MSVHCSCRSRSVRVLTLVKRRCRMQLLCLADQHQTEQGSNPVCERFLVDFLIGSHPREYSPIECDSCRATLRGARVLCMDCHNKRTLYLSSEPGCLDSVVSSKRRLGLKASHTQNHGVLKVHHIETRRRRIIAKGALEAARKTVLDLEAERKPMSGCARCRNMVSLPC